MNPPSRSAWRRDIALYGAIGGLVAAQSEIAAEALPAGWKPWVNIVLGVLVMVKAKMSNGHPDKAEHDPEHPEG